MIDLHCHLLPGIDDGARDVETALAMARMAVDDGIRTVFCTPHIYPGLYENRGPDIRARARALQLMLDGAGIPLRVNYGADTHLVPEVLAGLRDGRVPTLGGSRYFLLEPSHTVRPPRFVEAVFEFVGAGYVPIITHPERLTWVAEHYDEFLQLARSGVWLQITGGALLGKFGKHAQRYAERFVSEGWCAVLASDGHTTSRRAPLLAKAAQRAGQLIGHDEARRMVLDRPHAVQTNLGPTDVPSLPALAGTRTPRTGKIMATLYQWVRWRRASERT